MPILTAAPLAASSGSSAASSFIFLALMGLVAYFLLIRPQQRRVRSHAAVVQAIDVGDEVVTAGGIVGTVRSLDDHFMTLEVAPGVELRVVRRMVAERLSDPAEGQDDDVIDVTDEDQP